MRPRSVRPVSCPRFASPIRGTVTDVFPDDIDSRYVYLTIDDGHKTIYAPTLLGTTEILASIVRGLSNSDIACQLGISPRTVKDHLNGLFTKLGAANRAEAVAIALRKHLLKI